MRRLAAAGLLATAVDVVLLVVLRQGAGLPVIVADALSIAVAACLSYALNWTDERALFVWLTLLAGALDVVLCRTGVAVLGGSTADLLGAKAVALLVAGLLRAVAYRDVMFHRVRAEQARRVDRPAPPGAVHVSVVVPAYREAGRIATTVGRLRAAFDDAEIVVVDDGSGDGTADAARAAGADQVVVLERNRGKGAAVRTGALAARGRVVTFTDADLSYPPDVLVRLVAGVDDGWDMVVGSRRHVDTTTLVRARRLREVSGRVFNTLTRAVLLGHYRDTQCGVKAFRSDVARLLFERSRVDGFAFDVELFHLAERYHLALTEVPVEVANAETSSVRVGLDALRMVRDLFRVRRWAGQGRYDLAEEGESRLPGAWRR